MKVSKKKKSMRLMFASKMGILPKSKCPNCGEILPDFTGHFVMPYLGDTGFFTCEPDLPNPSKL